MTTYHVTYETDNRWLLRGKKLKTCGHNHKSINAAIICQSKLQKRDKHGNYQHSNFYYSRIHDDENRQI